MTGSTAAKLRQTQISMPIHKQEPPASAAPARDVQRRPVEEPGLVQQQENDDKRDEGERRVPDDVPHSRDVVQVDHAERERDNGATQRAPSDAEATRLPDDENQGNEEDRDGEHGRGPDGGRQHTATRTAGRAARRRESDEDSGRPRRPVRTRLGHISRFKRVIGDGRCSRVDRRRKTGIASDLFSCW